MRNKTSPNHYPKARVDALTDGIFAVAMTLLVLDIRLPDGFVPTDSVQMVDALFGLLPKFFPYALSFILLGLRWLWMTQLATDGEYLHGAYITWWLVYLLFITCLPFSTMLVGRYVAFAPAIWFYCINTALIAFAAWRMILLTPQTKNKEKMLEGQISMAVLLVSAIVCCLWSLWSPRMALFGFLLNALAPQLTKWRTTKKSTKGLS